MASVSNSFMANEEVDVATAVATERLLKIISTGIHHYNSLRALSCQQWYFKNLSNKADIQLQKVVPNYLLYSVSGNKDMDAILKQFCSSENGMCIKNAIVTGEFSIIAGPGICGREHRQRITYLLEDDAGNKHDYTVDIVNKPIT